MRIHISLVTVAVCNEFDAAARVAVPEKPDLPVREHDVLALCGGQLQLEVRHLRLHLPLPLPLLGA